MTIWHLFIFFSPKDKTWFWTNSFVLLWFVQQWTHLTTRVCYSTDVLVDPDICCIGVIRLLHRFLQMKNVGWNINEILLKTINHLLLTLIDKNYTHSPKHSLLLCKPGRLGKEPLPVVSGWFHKDWPLSSDSNYVHSCHSLVRSVKNGQAMERRRIQWQRKALKCARQI